MLIDAQREIFYPSSDGKRMADNTLQFRWIVTIEGGLEAVFAHDQNVFVAGDLLWYPIEGNTKICIAPDVLVALGRPKGDRKSYKQWEEENVAPQAVFEVLSHSNDVGEMEEKLDFYEEHGVEEYYLYDPHNCKLFGWRRIGDALRKIRPMNGWVSPLLKIRFEIREELVIYGPDGVRFGTFTEVVEDRNRQRQQAEQENLRAEQEKQRADQEKQRADQEKQRADQEKQRADQEKQRADQEKQTAEQAKEQANQTKQRADEEKQQAETRYEELLARLRSQGIEPDGLPPSN